MYNNSMLMMGYKLKRLLFIWSVTVFFIAAQAVALSNSGTSALLKNSRRVYELKGGTNTLASGGVAAVSIVLGTNAPAAVKYAASELKSYLDRITGGDFAIVNKVPASGGAIVLGATPQAAAAGIDVNSIARDGYAIECVAGNIFIAGVDDDSPKSEILNKMHGENLVRELSRGELGPMLNHKSWDFNRGTLYGAYRFLELLGVRWFFPGPKGEVIPHEEDLFIEAFSMLEEPHYVFRNVGYNDLWSRTGLNRRYFPYVDDQEYRELGWTGLQNRLWLLRQRGSSVYYAYNHRPNRLDWIERFGETHPEYFALKRDGTRAMTKALSKLGLCYSSEGMFNETMLDVEAFFAGKDASVRGIRMKTSVNRGWPSAACYDNSVSMLPGDGFPLCKCTQCKPRYRLDKGEINASDLVWPFVARVAERTGRTYPESLIFCLAYGKTTELPGNLEKLPDNVVVGLCPKIGPFKHNKTCHLVIPEARARVVALAGEWNIMSAMPMLGWFHHLFSYTTKFQAVPMYIPHDLAALCRDLSPYLRMMTFEYDADFLFMRHFNRYLLMRVLYDPDVDVDEIIADYCNKFYGPAAGLIGSLLADVELKSREIGELATENNITRKDVWGRVYTSEVLEAYRKTTDKAVAITAHTPYTVATELFSRRFIGAMEASRQKYWGMEQVMVYDELPCTWTFRMDPENVGLKEEWFRDVAGTGKHWNKTISIRKPWTSKYKYHGVAWYRVGLELPEEVMETLRRKICCFYFRGVDGYADFYLNGQKIGEQKRPPGEMWNTPFTIEIPPEALRSDGGNTLIVRVEKENMAAGIHKPISIISR